MSGLSFYLLLWCLALWKTLLLIAKFHSVPNSFTVFANFLFPQNIPFHYNVMKKKSNAIFYSLMSMSKIYLKGCRGQFGTSGTSDFFGKKNLRDFSFPMMERDTDISLKKKDSKLFFSLRKKIANFSFSYWVTWPSIDRKAKNSFLNCIYIDWLVPWPPSLFSLCREHAVRICHISSDTRKCFLSVPG